MIRVVLATCALTAAAQALHAQSDTTDAERRARRARQGAGLRVGSWMVAEPAGGASYSTWPAFEGYFQKGLDLHLVIETSGGVWRRKQTSGTGSGTEVFAVPMLTQLKFYPATRPGDRVEPFIAAGAGLSLGIERIPAGVGGPLGGGGSSQTGLIAGLGLKGSAGIEYRLGEAFGVAAYVAYQYLYFTENIGGQQSYKGLMIGGGLTYRYQY